MKRVIGPFLPSVTQYITMDEKNRGDVEKNWPRVVSYFANARRLIEEKRKADNSRQLINVAVKGLAFVGAAAIIDYLLGEEKKRKRRAASRRRFR